MNVVLAEDVGDGTEGRVLHIEIVNVIGAGGGAFGGYKGTCSILGRCIKTLGSDIAKWLANPTMDAKLGNV